MLTTAIVAAHFLGRQHTLQRAKRQGVHVKPEAAEAFAEPPIGVIPHEAVEFFKRSVKLPMKTLEKLVAQAQSRGQAITKAMVDQLREFIDGEILAAIREGTTLQQFTSRVQSMLQRAGLDPANPFRLETIFRTNLNKAYTQGRVEQLSHPDVKDTFQWLQYDAVMDGATRPTHAAMNGKVFRVDDPIWKTWMPPNGFNCRCAVIPVSKEDIEDEGLSVSRETPKMGGNAVLPDKGFRRG